MWTCLKCDNLHFKTITLLFLLFVCLFIISSLRFLLKHGTNNEKNLFSSKKNFLQLKNEIPYLLQDHFIPYVQDSGSSECVNARSDDASTNEQEALISLQRAIYMEKKGKDSKAFQLFQHAIALAPKHPEILTKYGEYLEHHRQDVVQADQLYFQALSVNPSYTQALTNRQRTESIVDEIDRRRLDNLEEKRNLLSQIAESNSALRRTKKEAYIQHIYHSVGIEGNTMSLAQTRSILETRMAVDGKTIDEHNEILGLDSAMKYINATLVNRNEMITVRDILEIHRRVLGHVDPIEGGEFRRTQVYVGGHVPPIPGELVVLMQRFEEWLNSEQAMSLHPVKFAALAHYKLVHIHPFTDGNGRTSRLLMNTILMKSGYPPIIIPKQQRQSYYTYLQLANEGDIRPFIRFIADCTEKTLDLYLWTTSDLVLKVPLITEENDSENDKFEEFEGSGEVFILNNKM